MESFKWSFEFLANVDVFESKTFDKIDLSVMGQRGESESPGCRNKINTREVLLSNIIRIL